MRFNSDFMSIYEELLTLQESPIVTITKSGTKITELENLVTKYRDVLNKVCQGVASPKGVAIFLAPDETRPHYTKAIAKVQTDADSENNIAWRYGRLGPAPGPRNRITKKLNSIDEQINFNLDGCWVGFFVVGSTTLAEPLIAALTDCTPELRWNDEVLLTKSGSLFGAVNNNNVFGICVKYSSSADNETLTSFVNPISAADVAQAIINTDADGVMKKSLAPENIKTFLTGYKNAGNPFDEAKPLVGFDFTEEKDIEAALASQSLEEFFSHIAFHAPSLAKYYQKQCQKKSEQAATIADVIKTFYHCPITGARSFQYLANAILQEKIISEKGEGILKYNDAATKANSDQPKYAHEYLVSTDVTPDSDFLYIGDKNVRDQKLIDLVTNLNGISFTRFTLEDATQMPVNKKQYDKQDDEEDTSLDPNSVDAKIFDNFASWQKYSRKASVTKAYYIIMNIKDSTEWYLFRQNEKRTGWDQLVPKKSDKNQVA